MNVKLRRRISVLVLTFFCLTGVFTGIAFAADPSVSEVKVLGTPEVGRGLYADYTYSGETADESAVEWLTADSQDASEWTAVEEAAKRTFMVTEACAGKYLKAKVTPAGGAAAESEAVLIPKTYDEIVTFEKGAVVQNADVQNNSFTVSASSDTNVAVLFNAENSCISGKAKLSFQVNLSAGFFLFTPYWRANDNSVGENDNFNIGVGYNAAHEEKINMAYTGGAVELGDKGPLQLDFYFDIDNGVVNVAANNRLVLENYDYTKGDMSHKNLMGVRFLVANGCQMTISDFSVKVGRANTIADFTQGFSWENFNEEHETLSNNVLTIKQVGDNLYWKLNEAKITGKYKISTVVTVASAGMIQPFTLKHTDGGNAFEIWMEKDGNSNNINVFNQGYNADKPYITPVPTGSLNQPIKVEMYVDLDQHKVRYLSGQHDVKNIPYDFGLGGLRIWFATATGSVSNLSVTEMPDESAMVYKPLPETTTLKKEIRNGNGAKVTAPMAGEPLKAVMVMENMLAKPKDCAVLFAWYKDGTLQGVTVKPMQVAESSVTECESEPITPSGDMDGVTVKAFVFDSLGTLRPLTNSFSFSESE